MKNNFKNSFLFSLFGLVVISLNAQNVKGYGEVQNSIGTTNNLFLDASDYTTGVGTNTGKGMLFPSADLTQWEFDNQNLGGIEHPMMNGVIVYNTATGQTKTGEGVQVNVRPGFYYFSNPNGTSANKIGLGRWVPMEEIQTGTGNPTATNTSQPGEIYVDRNTGDIYTFDGTNWNLKGGGTGNDWKLSGNAGTDDTADYRLRFYKAVLIV